MSDETEWLDGYDVWETKRGEKISIKDMMSSHLMHTTRYLEAVIMGYRRSHHPDHCVLIYLMNMKIELMRRSLNKQGVKND